MRGSIEVSRRHHWGLLGIALLTAGLIYWLAHARHSPVAVTAPAVAVSTAEVRLSDLAIAITELGAAQAWQAVTIRAQVNGRLLRVAVQEGADVKAGDLIAEIDPAPYKAVLTQAQGALERDKAQLEIARLDLDRYTHLVAEDSIAHQQLDTQQSLVKQLEGTVLIDQGAVAAAQVNLDYCRITSPVTGRVGVRLVDAGNLVATTDSGGIITVNQLVPMAVTFAVPQADFQRLSDASEGFRRALSTQAFSQDSGENLGSGELTVADNHVDPSTATVQMKARFPNTDRKLWPGQFVNVRLTLKVLHGSLSIPNAAVIHGPQQTFVYVVGPDHRAAVRPVTVVMVQDADAVIAAGLSPGDSVITDGQMSLRPGSEVIVHAPPVREPLAASPPSAAAAPAAAAPAVARGTTP
jgi:multidrug efflux system membrane fusion protein